MTEDWLLENLPEGWNYDCTFEPEAAFVIYAPEWAKDAGGERPHFLIPLRLLKDPREIEPCSTTS